ncbi:hypothetical protein D3C71_1653240 [compost metagenome]
MTSIGWITRNHSPLHSNAHGWRSTTWNFRPASWLSAFHDSSGSHASTPTAKATQTRGSRSMRRPCGNTSNAMKPTTITPMKR